MPCAAARRRPGPRSGSRRRRVSTRCSCPDSVLVAVSGGPIPSACWSRSSGSVGSSRSASRSSTSITGCARGSGRTPPTSARLAARHALPFHLRVRHRPPPAKGRRSRPGRVSSGTSRSREVDARDRRGEDRDRAHDGRPGGDGADRAGDRERDPRLSGHRAGNGHLGQPADRGRRARRSRRSAGRCTCGPERIRRTPTHGFLRNAIRLRGLPALERAVGRRLPEPFVRTAASLREDADELMRQTFEVLDDVDR